MEFLTSLSYTTESSTSLVGIYCSNIVRRACRFIRAQEMGRDEGNGVITLNTFNFDISKMKGSKYVGIHGRRNGSHWYSTHG